MDKLKAIKGQRHLLEQEPAKALSTGDSDTFDRLNDRLAAKGSLGLCADTSDPVEPQAPQSPSGDSFEHACQDVAARLKADTNADPLEKRTLLAIIDGREDDAASLLEAMTKRNALGLAVVKGEKEAPPQPSPARQLYVEDPATGRIRFTKAGHDRYAARLARVGYRIDDIRTKAAFEAAVDDLFQSEMNRIAADTRGRDAELDTILSGLPGWEED